MLHLLAMLFFSGAAVAALMMIWWLIGQEWDAVERALGLAEAAKAPCQPLRPARLRVRQARLATTASGWRAAA